ncbi:leishmanolysin-related zinc metalloendopeptidase [uncultured Marivita sp.]|uniref:leishmanolysin-related zinc metalloendopeptidase n=1 Tax=uncultured Marivita sp. TaxID=888080 RepID=UPI0026251938|nr:leishmanolysin-related zinc metalloendopeptidase [uncultured Marivita sp.]
MGNRNPLPGRSKNKVVEVLPEGFDLAYVEEFFATGKPSKLAREMVLPNASQDEEPAAPVHAQRGEDGLNHANAMTDVDLNLHAQPLRAQSDPEETLPDIGGAGAKPVGTGKKTTDDADGSGAKPAGRGKTSTDGGDSGGPGKGGGRNKTKTEPVDETDTTGGDATNTDGGSNTGGTDTGGSADTGDSSDTPDPQPSPVLADFVSGLDTPDGFNVSVSFDGAWTDSMIQQFVQGVEMISDIIIGDLPDVNGIDDIHITASLTSIDGSGGYWGWGGTTASRAESLLPSSGYIKLDEADIGAMESYDLIDDFVFHEILHALGFGTSWNAMGLVDTIDGSLRFIGENAIKAYNDVYSAIASNDPLSAYGVPVEMDGGSGTAGVHWDDATFGKEVMTGQLDFSNNVSDMTIAALQDMGYETVYSDYYTLV